VSHDAAARPATYCTGDPAASKGDFIQQRPEPGEAFEVLSNNFKTHLERTVKTRTSNFNNFVDVSK